jgi:hypothetical protein
MEAAGLSRKEANAFREAVLWDGYIMRNLKLWLFRCHRRGLTRKEGLALCKKFGLKKDDAKAYYYYLRYVKKSMPKIYSLCYSPKKFEAWMAECIEEVNTFTMKFVYKKLKFVFSGQGLKAEDIAMDLYLKGMQALCFYMPRVETREHAVNIIKKVIANHGKNIIGKNTTQKAGRIIAQHDGTDEKSTFAQWTNRIMNIEAATTTAVLKERYRTNTHDVLSVPITGTKNVSEHDYELSLDVKKMLMQASPKRKQFLRLLMGEFDYDFTLWLRDEELIDEDQNNQDFYDRMSKAKMEKLMQYICSFLKLSDERTKKWIRKTRRHLEVYKTA